MISLEEEERCGFIVTRARKKVWAAELDLLKKLTEVCRAHGLVCFLSGGTLLGCVRHNGFIPWDDDIDIGMPRADYEKLLTLAAEFEPPYHLQAPENEKGYYRGHAQLRNSNTAAVLPSEALSCDFDQGIFIDIFPYDRADFKAPATLKRLKRAGKLYSAINWHRAFRSVKKHSAAGMIKYALLSLEFAVRDYDRTFKKHNELCAACRDDNGDYFFAMNMNHTNPRTAYPWKPHEKLIPHAFEDMTVMIPEGWDELLTLQYGDWRKPVKAPTMHGGALFDTERPYTEVLKDIRAGKTVKSGLE